MHQARKRFGQHFLEDDNVIQHLVDVIAPDVGQHLVEIGPGLGALTIPVLRKTGQLEVVELDRDLLPTLRARTKAVGALVIHEADALKFDFGALGDGAMLRIIGNLPYNISTPLIFHLLEFAARITDMHYLMYLLKHLIHRLKSLLALCVYCLTKPCRMLRLIIVFFKIW
jgi:16S rRNA (adenine1518-N6/adenine1519-N6)-dimethyltransferase